jgi:ribosomal protein L11 methyltransferase
LQAIYSEAFACFQANLCYELPMTWKISFPATLELAPAWEEVLATLCPATTCFEVIPDSGDWRVEGYSDTVLFEADVQARLSVAAAGLGVDVPPVTLEKLAATDWVAENQKNFPPLTIGERFFIYGSHYKGAVPAGRIGFKIDAATAFGTGEHPTTQGCLILLERLKRRGFMPRTALDLGCGSAILAMAIKRLWPSCVVYASDNHAPSVRVAQENAARNKLRMKCFVAEGFKHRAFTRDIGQFDLIVANILASPLFALAPAITRHTQQQIILSGLLVRQESRLIQRYQAAGRVRQEARRIGAWSALNLRK